MTDTGCCGSNFRENSASILGLMTLSLPVIILSLLLISILSVVGVLSSNIRRLKFKISVILKANLNLIHLAPLTSKARCVFAGKIFSSSPRFSGIIYRYFNIALLLLLWFGVVFSFYLFYIVTRFIGK